MTPGKLEWRELESFVHDNKQRNSNKTASHKAVPALKAIKILGMLGGVLKMDVRAKSKQQAQIEDTSSSPLPDAGSALIQCVDQFFKNPQQNYEVPLQLVQEWFSETSTIRRQELAKLFLGLLQQQGLDMQQILGQMLSEYSPNIKSNDLGLEVVKEEEKTESETLPEQKTEDVNEKLITIQGSSCGEEESNLVKCSETRNQVESKQPPAAPTASLSVEEFPLAEKRGTRSVGTSPFQEGLASKCSSEPNITCRVKQEVSRIRKSQSLPSMKLAEVQYSIPSVASKETLPNAKQQMMVTPSMRTTNDFSPAVEAKSTVISNIVSPAPTSYKARTTFVEMSHADFMKRQMLLNDKVGVRQGFRLGGQILYVPELVSCSAPHEKTKLTPPLLVHSNLETKRVRNPVEIKLAMMNNSEVLENVVVSQTSSSHTIHYTPASTPTTVPSPTTAPAPASQLISDKCSVVYVRESLPHAHSVLVAATTTHTPTTTWQEEARKKPIIAYAKRKPPEQRDKGVIFGDNMKLLLTPNNIINSVHEVQSTNIVKDSKERDNAVPVPVAVVPNNGTNDVVLLKRTVEERRNAVVVVPTESVNVPLKATLPKFNQTFVQNFQVKPVRTVEQLSESPLDYLRKAPKKITSPFSPVSQVGAETTVVTEENGCASQDARLASEDGAVPASPPPASVPVVPPAPASVPAPAPVPAPTPAAPPTQVGLLIYTQASPAGSGSGSSEECSPGPVQTLLLTTLPNGSAYCVRLPPNANLHASSQAPHIQHTSRQVVVQAVSHGSPLPIKTSLNKPDAIPVAPPAESNKVALLKDLKEFENVFEETKLKFEKEKQLNVGDVPDSLNCTVNIENEDSPVEPAQPTKATIAKFDCENVIVGVKRKADNEIPVVTRLYTAAKKPLIVVANYGPGPGAGQTATCTQLPIVTQVCNTSPPVVTHTHIASKIQKPKSRSGKTFPNPAKSPPTAKPPQKPQEDEKTQQKIFAILEEYAVQKEHSPDTNNRPAPRRRSNPPSASASKKKRPLLKTKDCSGDGEDASFSEM